MEKRVLLMDLDPQGNATVSLGLNKGDLGATAFELMVEQQPLSAVATAIPNLGLDCVPADGDLTAAEVVLLSADDRENVSRLLCSLMPLATILSLLIVPRR